MDRPRKTRGRLDRRYRLALKIAAAPLALLLLTLALRAWLGPGVRRAKIRTSVAEVTPIEAIVAATGTLVPEIEETLSSPIAAPIAGVRVDAGERVAQGRVLVLLDTTREQVRLDNLLEQIALKDTELTTLEIQMEETRSQQESRRRLLEVDLESRSAHLERLQRLATFGAVAEDELKEARLDIQRTEIELEQATAGLEAQRRRHLAEVERIRLEHSILAAERDEQARRIESATVRAARSGVVTWVEKRAGLRVAEGQALARVAGDEGFRVAATVSDFYTPRLAPGQRVRVRATAGEIGGTLEGILPAAGASSLTLTIALEDSRAGWLRANLRVEADVITDGEKAALTVGRGPAVAGAGIQEVFVIQGGHATRRRVELGMASRDRVEVLSGLAAGEELIISDMSLYQDREEIRIR